MQVNELLKLVIDKKASDLHLRVPSPPILRINGKLVPQRNLPPVTPKDVEMLFESVTTKEQRDAFQRDLGVDFSYSISGLARFRISALKQRGSISLAFRAVPFQALSIDKLGIPQICKQFVLKPRGLILVTGPNGSGKSTTLAAMVDYLNENADKNIVTIEDPIEYLYQNKRSIIAQRDVGNDAKSFEDALFQALRHDPDVIVLGEMRSLSTIATGIRAAETGHLILGTLHATDAAQAVERIIDPFPAEQQQQIRLQLSQIIEAVLWQTLVPYADGTGRVAVFEILMN